MADLKKQQVSYFDYLQQNLLILSIFMVFLYGSFAVYVSKAKNQEPVLNTPKVEVPSVYGSEKEYPPLPRLINGSQEVPQFTARGIYVLDIESGVTLFDKDSTTALFPASTVKMMTAIVSAENYPFNQVITVPNINVEGQKMKLVPGEQITVENLLRGLLIFSANDAAEVLAGHYPGGKEGFVSEMNQKARALNLTQTVFTTPTGLDGDVQLTTAKDLVTLAEYGMRFPWFSDIVAEKETTVTSVDGKIVHNLQSTNELLGEIDGVYGVKTGWTENAHENLITYYEKDGHRMLLAVLGSDDRFGETKTLINWINQNYFWEEVAP